VDAETVATKDIDSSPLFSDEYATVYMPYNENKTQKQYEIYHFPLVTGIYPLKNVITLIKNSRLDGIPDLIVSGKFSRPS